MYTDYAKHVNANEDVIKWVGSTLKNYLLKKRRRSDVN